MNITEDDLWEEIGKAAQEYYPPRPKGCFTVVEYAKQFGLDQDRAFRQIETLVRHGAVEKLREKAYIDSRLRTLYRYVSKKKVVE